MLTLKMLVLKMVQKYIYKLSLFGRDDKKQAKSLIFIVLPQVEQFPKVQKKKPTKNKNKSKKKKKRSQMLLEPIIIAIMNLLNLQVVPEKVFLKYV